MSCPSSVTLNYCATISTLIAGTTDKKTLVIEPSVSSVKRRNELGAVLLDKNFFNTATATAPHNVNSLLVVSALYRKNYKLEPLLQIRVMISILPTPLLGKMTYPGA